jgi:phosphoribosylamine--glycine ligase
MKILVIDVASNALDLCQRWQAAGHEVKWYDKPRADGGVRRAGEGLVEKIRDFDELRKKWIGWADMIYTPDNTCYLDLLEPYRRIGYPIFGCNLEAVEMELDREHGQRVMAEYGLKTIPGKTFHDYDTAAAYVKKEAKAFVSKPSGDGERAMSYVSNNAADLVYMLQRWKGVDKYRKAARDEGFILQEKVNGVAEMAVGGWFIPGVGFSKAGWVENFEHKSLFAGDLGVATGEMGTIVRVVKKSKLADLVLKPVADHLHKIGYIGYVDVATIIDDKGVPWPLEFTMRDGWPIRHNLTSLIIGDQAQWMKDACDGKDTLKIRTDVVSASVVMALPDFPYSHVTNRDLCGIPVYGAEDMEHLHWSEVMMGVAPRGVNGKVVDLPGPVTAGDYTLVATGEGATVSGARRSVYAAIKKVKIPNSPFYRIDIGSKMKKQLPILQAMGFATGMEY